MDDRPKIYQNFIHLGEECSLIPALVINMCGCNLSCPTCPERFRWHANLPISDATAYAHALARFIAKHPELRSIEWIGGEPTLQIRFVLKTSALLRKIRPDAPPIYLNSNMHYSDDVARMLFPDEFCSNKKDDAAYPSACRAIDAFVFDLKCMPECSKTITGASDYFETASQNIALAVKFRPDAPHILRHLVMPGHVGCCTIPVLDWCKNHIPNVTVNLMTTFHDFRPDAQGPLFLPEEDKQNALKALKESGLCHYLIDGKTPENGEI